MKFAHRIACKFVFWYMERQLLGHLHDPQNGRHLHLYGDYDSYAAAQHGLASRICGRRLATGPKYA